MIFNLLFSQPQITIEQYQEYAQKERVVWYYRDIKEYSLANQDIIKPLAKKLKTINGVIKYLNKNFTYKADKVEYPQYPIETLYLKTGDCEDYTILMQSILYQLGYTVYTVDWGDHLSVGIEWKKWIINIEPRHGIMIADNYKKKEYCIYPVLWDYVCNKKREGE